MKKSLNAISVLLLLTIVSCKKDEIEVYADSISVTDCNLSRTASSGICLDGEQLVLPNEVLTYASKSTPNLPDIEWTVESGNMEILSIEFSDDFGFHRTVATIKFDSNFSGGSISVRASSSTTGSFAEIAEYSIELK